MKTAEPKTTATAQHSQSRGDRSQHQPFFESLSAGEATVSQGASFFSPKGGGAIQRMPFFGSGSMVQPKLRIGQSGDRYEQEADRTADQVVHRSGEWRGRSGTDSTVKTGIQRKPIFESDEKLQKMEEPGEEETFQRKPIFESDAPPDEDAVQRQGASGGEGGSMSASPGLESRLQSSRGSGAALPEETRVQMESAMGADFTGVRLHTGSEAAGMNEELGARAFTHGSDIYFNEGQYQPGSSESDQLLAHELTHTIQQGAIQRKTIQKANGGGPGSSSDENTTGVPAPVGFTIDPDSKVVTFDTMELPPFRVGQPGYGGTLVRPRNYERPPEEEDKNREMWKAGTAPASSLVVRPYLEDRVKEKIKGKSDAEVFVDPGKTYLFLSTAGISSKKNRYVMGTLDTAVAEYALPTWDKTGSDENRIYNVDHKKERQFGGDDNLDNMQLLLGYINKASGYRINIVFLQKAGQVQQYLESQGNTIKPKEILKQYEMRFKSAVPDDKFRYQTVDPQKAIWTRDDIMSGKHFQLPRIDRLVEVGDLEKLGTQDEVLVFPMQTGWIPQKFRNKPEILSKEKGWLSPWRITKKDFKTDIEGDIGDEVESRFGTLTTRLDAEGYPAKGPRSKIRWEPQPEKDRTLTRVPGARYAGFLNRAEIQAEAEALRVGQFSPVRIDTFDLTPTEGIYAKGQILPTIPLIKDIGLEFELKQGQVSIFKEFTADEFKFPGPITVTGSTLRISAGTEGITLGGQADFEVARVGAGFVGGAVTSDGEFALKGGFDFDSTFFDPARIELKYEEGIFSGTGELGIPPGKVKGIKSAKLIVLVEGENWSASGTIEPEVPGVEQASMQARFDPEGGLEVGGTLTLTNEIPGIRGGTLEADVRQREGGEGYAVRASGDIPLDIPGIKSSLHLEYNDGAVEGRAEASYEKGMLSGGISVGVTNRPVGEDGESAGEPSDTFTVYGGGELTLTLTPWLKGTAGVEFLPNGEIQVKGEIGLPSEVNVFDRIGIPESELFSLGFDIPIFAIPVGPKSIGLKASIRGGLRAYAGIGPGKLTDTRLGIEYNPAHEDQTHLYGSARFVVPADAGLKFFVRATIGLNAVIGGVEGGLEVSAGVGLDAEASAGVNVDWTPASGLELRAMLAAHIQPKFTFDIDGVIEAWFAWYDKEWRWKLASYEYGPDMRFGIRLPIVYKEGEPFDISFDDIQFETPKIDSEFLKGLIRDIKNSRS